MNILRIDILGPFVHEIVTKTTEVHFGLNVLDYVAKTINSKELFLMFTYPYLIFIFNKMNEFEIEH